MQERLAKHTPRGEIDRIGFFGKLPTHGDFVSWGLPVELQRQLQDWLQSGLQTVHEKMGEGWRGAFKAMPSWRFIVEQGLWSPLPLAGVLVPSADRVGREFPLVILSQIHASADHPFQLYKDDSWFTAVEAIAESGVQRDFQLESFTTALQKLRSLRPLDAEEDAARGASKRAKETLWWRVAAGTRAVQGFRNPGSPRSEDFIRLIGQLKPAVEPTAMGSVQLPATEALVVQSAVQRTQPSLQTPAFKWEHAFQTHPGTRQRLNCDALLTANSAGLFAVADGFGDTAGAADAAKLTIHLAGQATMEGPIETRLQDLKGKLGRANSLLRSRTEASSTAVVDAASLAVLMLDQSTVVALWAGDARCYLLRDGMLRCLTRDHVQVGMKRSLTRGVGLNATFHGDHVVEDLRLGDCFLLCTAPLARALPDRAIAEILLAQPPHEVPRVLIENALIAGCPDNITALIVHVQAG